MRLKGKTALVTGASRNIGRAVAFPAEGADLVLNTRVNHDELEAVACVLLASDASAYVTGDSIRVRGGRVIG